MKKNLLILFLVTLFIIINCSCSMFNNDDLGNTPLDIPDYVLYGMLHTNGVDYITVIDMEKDSIIGYYRITKENESIGDFCLGSDNLLYLTIDPLLSSSNEVRIFDPKKGKIVGKITTEYCPYTIFLLPENKAFIFHYFVKAGDSAVINSVIDLTNKVVIKKIISYLGGPGYQEMFTSPNNDIWIFSNSPLSDDTYIIKFITDLDTLGERILLKNKYNGMEVDPSLTKFVSENKIYARCDLIYGIVIYDFPTGEIANIIPLEIKPVDILSLPNGKVYISQYDYYSPEGNDNYITVIDANSDAEIKRIMVCPGPFYLTYSEALNKLYIGSIYENSIAVIDPNTDSLIKLIKGDSLGSDLNRYCRLIPNK